MKSIYKQENASAYIRMWGLKSLRNIPLPLGLQNKF